MAKNKFILMDIVKNSGYIEWFFRNRFVDCNNLKLNNPNFVVEELKSGLFYFVEFLFDAEFTNEAGNVCKTSKAIVWEARSHFIYVVVVHLMFKGLIIDRFLKELFHWF